MGTERYITGDAAADKLLRLIAAHVEAVPQPQREDVRDGTQSLPFNYRYLVGQTGMDSVAVKAALAYLHNHRYVQVDFGHQDHEGNPSVFGCHVWMKTRLVVAA